MFDEIARKSLMKGKNVSWISGIESRIFERSVEENRSKPLFSFYDGPPFATGLPHYGHLSGGDH